MSLNHVRFAVFCIPCAVGGLPRPLHIAPVSAMRYLGTTADFRPGSPMVPGPMYALTWVRAYIGFCERCIADDTAPFYVAGMLGAERQVLPEGVALEVKAHFANTSVWLEHVF